LFGALLRELGVVARRDVIFATFGVTVAALATSANPFARLFFLPFAAYGRLFATPAAKVADAYAALNGALHHLIQYLSFARGVGAELLTARANVPRLVETTAQMLALAESAKPPERAGRVLGAPSADRAPWLARVFHGGALARPRFPWMRVLGGVAVAALSVALLVRAVSDAIAYHPTYVQRTSNTEGGTRR
jgi:hypothetical protein